MIIGITGMLGAGKGTIVDFLVKRGFKHYSVRDFLIDEIKLRGMVVNRDSMVVVANEFRERFGSGYIFDELYKKALSDGVDAVIESIRSVGEVNSLKDKGGILFGVDADIETRYSRIVERGSVTDKISFEKFVSNEEREMSSTNPNNQNLRKCLEMSDYVFKNDWTIEELHRKVEKVLNDLKIKGNKNIYVKRKDVLSWDEYFMAIAGLSAQRSKDPNTQVGACIVDPNKKIIGVGYNGFPKGCSDDLLPWGREGDFLDVKYPYVCHAELNAILNSGGRDLSGASIYVYLFPCNECSKAIIQSGIKEVVYLSDKYSSGDSAKAARKMFEMAGVKTRQLICLKKSVSISFDENSV